MGVNFEGQCLAVGERNRKRELFEPGEEALKLVFLEPGDDSAESRPERGVGQDQGGALGDVELTLVIGEGPDPGPGGLETELLL